MSVNQYDAQALQSRKQTRMLATPNKVIVQQPIEANLFVLYNQRFNSHNYANKNLEYHRVAF